MRLLPSAIRIKLIKRFDSLIGIPLTFLLSAPVYQQDILIKSILIIRPGGIGDALLLAPAIKSLRARYADASITILAERRNAGAFALIPAVDKLLQYDRSSDFMELLFTRYDLIIDTEQWHRMSAVITRLVGSAMKIGFGTNDRKKLFTHSVPYSHEEYEVQSLLNLLHPLGIVEGFDPATAFLYLPDSAKNDVNSLIAENSFPYITIFPGASVKERRWGENKFSQLVKLLSSRGIRSVIVGGKDEQHSGETIVSGSSGMNMAGKTSIADTAAIIARSRILVSGDSGVLHIGVGLGISTVSIFGAGIAKKWAPRGEKHIVLNRNLACSPCTLFGTTPPCPYHVRCLAEIDVESVYKAVVALFEK